MESTVVADKFDTASAICAIAGRECLLRSRDLMISQPA